jgi:twinkle protein
MEHEESEVVESKLPCDDCGSSDAKHLYSDGHTYCFSCQKVGGEREGGSEHKAPKRAVGLIEGEFMDLTARGINEQTTRKFGYKCGIHHLKLCHIAEYRDAKGGIVAQKLRFADKGEGFPWLGEPKGVELFGSHLWGNGRKIVICEGEIDAMSVSQMQQNKWPVVSISHGASGAKKELALAWDYLDAFDEIILMFDNDEPGRTAAQQVAEALPPGRVKIATLPLKDANEMLMARRSAEVINAIFQAKPYRPDGILSAADLKDLVQLDSKSGSVPYPWPGMNKITRGVRSGELVTITAGSGTGKSAIVREIAYALHQSGEKVGMIMLEESIQRTLFGLLGLHMNLPLSIPEDCEGVDQDAVDKAFGELLGNEDHSIYLYDHFGSTGIENLLARIRYLAMALDCKWVILDHLSIVVSGVETNDERKSIDVAMTKLRTLVQETGIGLILVSHLTRPQGDKGHEEGAKVALKHLRGSHSIVQLSDMVIAAERDQQDETMKNWTHIRVLKNRYTGETGSATWVEYDPATGRLAEGNPEFSDETGGVPKSELPF